MAEGLAGLFAAATPAQLPAVPEHIERPAATEEHGDALSKDHPQPVARRSRAVSNRPVETPERTARTLFVGNLPVSLVGDRAQQREFRALFASLEPRADVESVRFRSLVSAGPAGGVGKRVAFITGAVHAERDACNAFVVLQRREDAERARAALNGRVFLGRHVRVDAARGPTVVGKKRRPTDAEDDGDKKDEKDTEADASRLPTKRSVFLGNLPLNVSDEAVWAAFEPCGRIDYVRVVRDRETGLGKGFGYVAFVERASVELATQLAGTDVGGRPVRVSKCAKQGYVSAKKAFLAKRAQASGVVPEKRAEARESDRAIFDKGRASGKAALKDGQKPRRFYPAREHTKKTFGDVLGAARDKARPPKEKKELHPALRRKQMRGMARLPALRAST